MYRNFICVGSGELGYFAASCEFFPSPTNIAACSSNRLGLYWDNAAFLAVL